MSAKPAGSICRKVLLLKGWGNLRKQNISLTSLPLLCIETSINTISDLTVLKQGSLGRPVSPQFCALVRCVFGMNCFIFWKEECLPCSAVCKSQVWPFWLCLCIINQWLAIFSRPCLRSVRLLYGKVLYCSWMATAAFHPYVPCFWLRQTQLALSKTLQKPEHLLCPRLLVYRTSRVIVRCRADNKGINSLMGKSVCSIRVFGGKNELLGAYNRHLGWGVGCETTKPIWHSPVVTSSARWFGHTWIMGLLRSKISGSRIGVALGRL